MIIQTPRRPATATSTKNFEPNGKSKSTEAKSAAQGVASGLRQAHRGISDTATSTEASIPDPSTVVATELLQPTKPGDAESTDQSDQSFQTGGQVDLSVTAAVERDLAEIAKSDPNLAVSGLAALALALAHKMDDGMADTAVPMCAGQLRDTLHRLRELCPPEQKADELDELAARRAIRLAGDSAAAN